MSNGVVRKIWLKSVVTLVSLLLMGGGHAVAYAANDKLNVVTSFSILADMVANVGGEHIDVVSIVGRNADSHGFEPTPKDARKLAGADLLFINGLEFEAWLPRLLEAAGFKGKQIVLSRGVTPLAFSEPEEKHAHEVVNSDDHSHEHGNVDPHAWQDPVNAIVYVQNIAQGLVEADPANAASYRARAQSYIDAIRQVDHDIRQALESIPQGSRTAVTSHDAFGYFAKAYGIQLFSTVGVSSQAEASAKDVARLIDLVRKKNVKAIFIENITNPRLIEQIARETGASVGGALYSDALAQEGQAADSYLGMMRWNANLMLKALKGK